jgi:NAD(P)H-hydrate epimerase
MSAQRLPGWLQPLPDADEQRALDSWAIEQLGIPGERLMERAGRGLAEVCRERRPDGPVAVVCGKGNNGGDGLVAARLLRERQPDREVNVLFLGDPAELRGDARTNLERLPGAPPQPFLGERLDEASMIVDAILGTGSAGEPREPARGAIRAINRAHGSGAEVIACDIPSGVDASTGEVAGEAVYADATVTFHAAKPGLWIRPGKQLAGEITVIDIGIPSEGAPGEPRIGLITSRVLEAIPRRASDSTKFSAGSVLVCGGSPGLTGAPTMASMAAARAGAGYVTVAVPASLVSILASKLMEVMQVGLAEREGALAPEAVDTVLERSRRVQAVVLGPGLGREGASLEFARAVARSVEVPMVLDADGLNAHAGERLSALAARTAPAVLTPHAGELGRLLDIDSEAVGAQRLHRARQAAAVAGSIVILKGDDTIVAEPEGRVGVSAGGSPALATAGTGDVLSGVLAAHLARGMEPFDAACAAVFVHAAAGRLAARRIGPEGVIAGDVIQMLPAVLASPER